MLDKSPQWQPNMTRAAEVRRTVDTFMEPGQVTEVRALKAEINQDYRPVLSGYFDSTEALVSSVEQLPKCGGIYMIPNPIDPRLLARAANRFIPARSGMTTADEHILHRKNFTVDLDPVRPGGISSTDQELACALAKADAIQTHLQQEGWPPAVKACSGNGANLIYKIDLPPNDGGLIAKCLQALSNRFGDEQVAVDTVVGNPARGIRLYGTQARKGDPTPERPHRHSQILFMPNEHVAVPNSLLAKLAATVPSKTRFTTHFGGSVFDIYNWLLTHNLPVTNAKPWKGGKLWSLKICPWNPEHKNSSAYIIQSSSGQMFAGCHHNSCQGKNWADLRRVIEPNWQPEKPHIRVPQGAPPAIVNAYCRATTNRKSGGSR